MYHFLMLFVVNVRNSIGMFRGFTFEFQEYLDAIWSKFSSYYFDYPDYTWWFYLSRFRV